MNNDGAEIRAALLTWFEEVTGETTPPVSLLSTSWSVLARADSWPAVRVAVGAAAGPDQRPDLYTGDTDPQLSDVVLLETSGLARAALAAANGLYVSADDLAADFSRFCTDSLQPAEDWLLLDGSFPAETNVGVGEYTLQTCTSEELSDLNALPSLDRLLAPDVLPYPILSGAAFLHRISPNQRLQRGAIGLPLLHTRPEILHWKPLVTLLLWQDSDVLRMESLYAVRRGHSVRRLAGEVTTGILTYPAPEGEEEVEIHQRGSFRVDASDLPRLAAFCTAITARIEAILADQTGKSGRRRALRLSRAAEHLVRAAHRTFGNSFVWDEEVDEIILHYVIAMEALLADENNLDLSRKVAYRAASMWRDDGGRMAVEKVVRGAYGHRSKYAHGGDTGVITPSELSDIRSTAIQVLLRWLVLSNGPDLPGLLDKSQLSDTVRRTAVIEPLTAFFAATPPAQLPRDT